MSGEHALPGLAREPRVNAEFCDVRRIRPMDAQFRCILTPGFCLLDHA